MEADYEAVISRFFMSPSESPAPGWEAAKKAQDRIVRVISEIRDSHRGEDVAIVSHGLVLMLYLSHVQKQHRVDLAAWRSVGFPDVALLDGERVVQRFQGISDKHR